MRFISRFTAAEVAADGELGYWSMLRADDAFFERLPSVESVIERLPAMEILADMAEGAGPVIMMNGDEVYVRRFAPNLLQSIARCSPGASVALNVVAPSDGMLNLLMTWRKRLPLNLGLSYERPDLAAWPQSRRSSYFAAARFIRAFQWRLRLDRPIIVLDLDALVRSDLRLLATDMEGYDLGLLLDPRRRGPFREITVCYNYYNDTPLAGRFLATTAAYIGHFLLDAEPRWLLDQTAHLAALHWLRREHPSPRVRWYDFQTFPHCGFIGEK
jgi:hypothetical protein